MSGAHEHDPRAVAALGVEVFDAMYPGAEWANVGKADHCLVAPVVRVILTREAALVAALEDAECELSSIARIHRARPEQVALAKIRDALRAHRASRQPSEHDKLAEAREALAEMVPAACDGNALSARWWAEQWGLIVLAALDGHAAALAAARAEGAAEAYERAAKVCDHHAQGNGEAARQSRGEASECFLAAANEADALAAAIRAQAERERP